MVNTPQLLTITISITTAGIILIAPLRLVGKAGGLSMISMAIDRQKAPGDGWLRQWQKIGVSMPIPNVSEVQKPLFDSFHMQQKGVPKDKEQKTDARSMMFPRKSSSTCPTFLWLGVAICLLYLLMFGYTDREKIFVYLSISSVSLDVWIYLGKL